MDAAWWRIEKDVALILRVHVQPGARRTEVVGLQGDALKIRLAAAPLEGRANACLTEFVAQLLGARRASVELVRGGGSRFKVLRIDGAQPGALAALQAQWG